MSSCIWRHATQTSAYGDHDHRVGYWNSCPQCQQRYLAADVPWSEGSGSEHCCSCHQRRGFRGGTLLLMSPEVLEELRECVWCWHDAHAPGSSGTVLATGDSSLSGDGSSHEGSEDRACEWPPSPGISINNSQYYNHLTLVTAHKNKT